MCRNQIHRIIEHIRLRVAKKIIHRSHCESTKMLLELRSFATVLTEIGQNHVARADQQMDRKWIAFKNPVEYRRIEQSDERSSAVFVQYETGCSCGQTLGAWITQLFPSLFVCLFGHFSCSNALAVTVTVLLSLLAPVMVWKCWNLPPVPVTRWWAIGFGGMTVATIAEMWRAELWRNRFDKLERQLQPIRSQSQSRRLFSPTLRFSRFEDAQFPVLSLPCDHGTSIFPLCRQVRLKGQKTCVS